MKGSGSCLRQMQAVGAFRSIFRFLCPYAKLCWLINMTHSVHWSPIQAAANHRIQLQREGQGFGEQSCCGPPQFRGADDVWWSDPAILDTDGVSWIAGSRKIGNREGGIACQKPSKSQRRTWSCSEARREEEQGWGAPLNYKVPGRYGSAALATPQGPFLHDDRREIFPLPKVYISSPPLGLFSRKSRQRMGKRRHFEEEVGLTVDAANTLYGRPGNLLNKVGGSQTFGMNGQALEFIEHAVRRVGSPCSPSGPEALEELRVAVGYEDLPTTCPLGSFNADLIALPSEGVQPRSLEMLWGEGGRLQVEEFTRTKTLGPAEAARKLELSGLKKCYEDPQFHQYSVFASFVKRLHNLGMVSMHAEPPTERVGIFFVKKKGGKLRMILDCRRSNCHFADPDPVVLATGDAMSRIELEGKCLHTASADLQNAFYTMAMPSSLQQFFGLRKVRAGDVGVSEIGGKPVQPDSWLHPRLAVLPMGWSHAMWWCQQISEHVCEKSGLTAAERLQDGSPCPSGNFFHIQYVDNLHVFGTNKAEVEDRFWKAVSALREAGLSVHEIEFGDQETKVLGWNLDSKGILSPSLQRLWKVRMAIREILRRGQASGQQLERLMGHITFVSLCRQESLSVFGNVCTFIKRHYAAVAPLWKSVRKELQQWDGLSPLVFCDMKTTWSDIIYAVDASEWGLGVVQSNISGDEAQRLGRWRERWRFKDDSASNPRVYVRTQDEQLCQLQHVSTDTGRALFQSCSFEVVNRKWKLVGRNRWKIVDSIPVYEARSTQYAIRHFLRTAGNFNKRLIILTDSMTAAVAFDKGRAHSFRMRRVLQQTAAFCLVSGLQFRCRWIPSEWNPADNPSTSGFSPSVPVRDFWNDTPTTWGDRFLVHTAKSQAQTVGGVSNLFAGSQTAGGGERTASDLGHRVEQLDSFSETTTKSQPQTGPKEGRAVINLEGQLGECSDQGPISGLLGQVGFLEQQSNQQQYPFENSGWFGNPISGRAILSGRRHEQGQLCHRSSDVSCAGVKGSLCIAFGPADNEGLEAVVSSESENAYPLRGALPFGDKGSGDWENSSGTGDVAYVPFVSPALGRIFAAKTRHCGSGQESRKGLQTLLYTPAPFGRGDTFEDHAVGRDASFRPSPSTVCGAMSGEGLKAGRQTSGGKGLFHHPFGCEPVPAGAMGSLGLDCTGKPSCIQVSPRGGFLRGGQQISGAHSNPSPGPLAESAVCQELREGRKASAAFCIPQQASPKKMPRRKKRPAKAAAVPALSVRASLAVAVFLEIFSGCGRLGASVAEHCGWPVLLWDITYGEDYDLTKRCNQMKIIHWISSGLVRAGHLGTPCNSFSRARDQPGGPPPLRSDTRPLGLADLRPADAAKVKLGNRLMYFSCTIFRLALHWRIPFTMENPARSRLCPTVQWLLKRKQVQASVVDFCAFGTAWKNLQWFWVFILVWRC